MVSLDPPKKQIDILTKKPRNSKQMEQNHKTMQIASAQSLDKTRMLETENF
jgi:hypothetical protein